MTNNIRTSPIYKIKDFEWVPRTLLFAMLIIKGYPISILCEGDSMINARIYDGDIVYIREQPQVENGEIAACLVDGEFFKNICYLPVSYLLPTA